MRTGAGVFECEPYLSEDRYREELSRGRILFSELRAVVERDLGAQAGVLVHAQSTRIDLWLAMLKHPLRSGDGRELDWFMAEPIPPWSCVMPWCSATGCRFANDC